MTRESPLFFLSPSLTHNVYMCLPRIFYWLCCWICKNEGDVYNNVMQLLRILQWKDISCKCTISCRLDGHILVVCSTWRGSYLWHMWHLSVQRSIIVFFLVLFFSFSWRNRFEKKAVIRNEKINFVIVNLWSIGVSKVLIQVIFWWYTFLLLRIRRAHLLLCNIMSTWAIWSFSFSFHFVAADKVF